MFDSENSEPETEETFEAPRKSVSEPEPKKTKSDEDYIRQFELRKSHRLKEEQQRLQRLKGDGCRLQRTVNTVSPQRSQRPHSDLSRPQLGSVSSKEEGDDGPTDGDEAGKPVWWVEGLAKGQRPEDVSSTPLIDYCVKAINRNWCSFWRCHEDDRKRSGDQQFYRSPTFVLIGLLKDREEFKDLEGYDAALLIEDILKEFCHAPHEREVWDLKWENPDIFDRQKRHLFPHIDIFDTEIDPRDSFIDTWEKVTATMTLEPKGLIRAKTFAEEYPLRSSRFHSPRDKKFLRAVSLCFWLSRMDEEQQFFLSCRDAGEYSGCSHVQASGYLKRMLKIGLLEQAEYRPTSCPKHRRAHEYVFDLKQVSQ